MALITQDFPPEVGGIETYSAELAKRFAEYCDRFLVVAPAKQNTEELDHHLSYPVYRVSASNSFIGLKAIPEAPRILKSQGIKNTFHTQWQTLPSSVFARKQGTVDNIFVAAHARELLFNPFEHIPGVRSGYQKYKRWLLSQADLFFPVSNYTATLLEKHGVDSNKIYTVINGTDPDLFYPADTLEARKQTKLDAGNVMLTISRLVSRKGVDTALKAFQQVLKKYPDSCYVIVGDGPQKEELVMLARNLRIIDSVIFAGRIPQKKLLNYYNACDVFVMPSKSEYPNVEGFGIVFLEANACKKPVIGTYSGGIPSAIIDGETGILVKESDSKLLSDAIIRLFTDKQLARSMGEKGRKRVKAEANWDVSARKLLQYMESEI